MPVRLPRWVSALALTNPKRSKVEPYTHLLGKVPDKVIAEAAGVSTVSVHIYRKKLGIPSWRETDPEAEKKIREMGSTRHSSAVAPYTDMLGTVPDRVVAEEAGVSIAAVATYRRSLGIPSWQGYGRGSPKKTMRSHRTEGAILGLLARPQLTAQEIADLSGYAYNTVYKALGKLKEGGFVVAERGSPPRTRRGTFLYSLTPKGRAAWQEMD